MVVEVVLCRLAEDQAKGRLEARRRAMPLEIVQVDARAVRRRGAHNVDARVVIVHLLPHRHVGLATVSLLSRCRLRVDE